MYYHASQTANIKELKPSISNHNKPLIYFSNKRENVLVYLSNAVEKFCKENNYNYDGIWKKWASYGFNKDGILEIQEYYPNATYETYSGVSGYIYFTKNIPSIEKQDDIPNAFHTHENVKVNGYEYIENAYNEKKKEIEKGNIALVKYEDFIKEYKNINIIFKRTNNKIHDRYIILDYNSEQEQIYLCGSSSKDSGNKITTITKINDNNIFHNMIDNLLENKQLILT